MCGIICSIHHPDADGITSEVYSQLLEANSRRGPDHHATIMCSIDEIAVELFASVLHLRGYALHPQPFVSQATGNAFCWNGEVFEGLDIHVGENDGTKIFALLDQVEPDKVPVILANLEGPYSFVFYHKASSLLFFGRDPLGRRSLLIHQPTTQHPEVVITSVTDGPSTQWSFEEVAADTIFSVKLDLISNGLPCITPVPRHPSGSPTRFTLPKPLNTTLPHDPETINISKPLPIALSIIVDEFLEYLDRSVALQVDNIPRLPLDASQARVAVLFSGGIDSTIVAFLANRHIPLNEPIDLLNVAFENPRTLGMEQTVNRKFKPSKLPTKSPRTDIYSVPDRVVGLEEVDELRRLCPGRIWNFVEINVPLEESKRERSNVEAVMFPARTLMDLSLAQALYFAARGKGMSSCNHEDASLPHTTAAKVLLSGLGSDELLGGYVRHRNAFRHASWKGLIEEVQKDVTRLPARNLGRDDRVISSHGKETRHPFLSLSILSYLSSLPINMKVDPRLEEGLGDKMLLRLLAEKLGLTLASRRKKRAMQFGTRSARMESGKADGKEDILSEVQSVEK